MSEAPSGPPIHTEGTAPGAELNNYRNKKVSDDGTYVVITDHSERIEVIPQPLTPEEIEAQRKDARTGLAIVGSMVLGFLGLVGWMTYMDSKSERRDTGEFPSDDITGDE